jgi:hypothetical protein
MSRVVAFSRNDCPARPTKIYVDDIELRRDGFTCRTLLSTPTFAARRGEIKVNVYKLFEEKALVGEDERQDECLLAGYLS